MLFTSLPTRIIAVSCTRANLRGGGAGAAGIGYSTDNDRRQQYSVRGRLRDGGCDERGFRQADRVRAAGRGTLAGGAGEYRGDAWHVPVHRIPGDLADVPVLMA